MCVAPKARGQYSHSDVSLAAQISLRNVLAAIRYIPTPVTIAKVKNSVQEKETSLTPFLSESDLSKQVSDSPDTGCAWGPTPEGPGAVFPQRCISCCTDFSGRTVLAAIRLIPTPVTSVNRIFYFVGESPGERNFFTPFLSESDLSKQVFGSPDTGRVWGPIPRARGQYSHSEVSLAAQISRRNVPSAIRFIPTPVTSVNRIFYFVGEKILACVTWRGKELFNAY
ncbi:hypothetical protein CDAR_519681 [Caerostris darwini]|uniref:Uncharacterized protein n=1 Tax=Caerostris darwini TaxID=1538125 RepID=A0AAV4RA89_9ARAC|nr:hypothetical protein CDAR_519681 [Caerostris darwini]